MRDPLDSRGRIAHSACFSEDNVAVDIDSVIYYHIVNPYKAAYGISDVRQALIERSQTTLRHVVGSRNLQSVRDSIRDACDSFSDSQ